MILYANSDQFEIIYDKKNVSQKKDNSTSMTLTFDLHTWFFARHVPLTCNNFWPNIFQNQIMNDKTDDQMSLHNIFYDTDNKHKTGGQSQ